MPNAQPTTGINDSRISVDQRNIFLLLWFAAGTLVLLTWAHVLTLSNEALEQQMTSSQGDLSNLTRVSQEHAIRTLRSADQVIRFIRSRYLEIGNRLDLAELTRQGVIDTEIFNQVGIIDSKGIYILSNQKISGKMDLSDREHFLVHVNQDTGQLFISKPVIGRATGKWSVQLTRRINGPKGEFAGVVVVSIDPGYFTRFYGELNLGPSGLTALYGLDGIARARRVGDKEDFGANAAGSALFNRLASQEMSGTYTQKSVIDNVERVFYFRKIPQYPLAIIAGIDLGYLLAGYQSSRNALFLQAGLVSALVIILAASLTRHLLLLKRETLTRQAAQLQSLERTEQLNAVFELSPDGFVSFDQNHCVKYVNPAFGQMTGVGTTQLEGLDERDFSAWLRDLCEPNAAFKGIQHLRGQPDNPSSAHQQTIELRGPGKRILQVQLRISGSTSVSQILYFRDITLETEVESMKSEFLATAAHELRTPMASIYGFAEVLLMHETDPTSQKEFLGIIHRQSKLMVDILNELLDLARIEARRGKDFKFVRLCLQDLLQDLARSYQCPTGRQPPVMEAPANPIYLNADAGKLRQALLNVLANAYKYSPDGGNVEIKVELPPSSGQDDQVLIHISDHGMGLTPDQLEKVFTRFYRADTSGKVPGTGLGMSITKEIVEHHKGTISLVSAAGEGTRVTFRLPVDSATPTVDAAL